ncbi:MAG TPA: hypothetical protein VFY36_07160 [Solirubrobacteraceae bacterium]|nr:hypothetical protein [Solirubrobacteraceae bacterium]
MNSEPAKRAREEIFWRMRLSHEADRIEKLLPARLRVAHDMVESRARGGGAQALLLTGSTARGTRTPSSDLDYHLIGTPIAVDCLPDELDIHVVSPARMRTRLLEGDDFTHWSLRFGCVVFDTGIVRASNDFIAEQELWPDPLRKWRQAHKSLRIAREMVASGDHEAAVEQVRTALTLTARWRLLADRSFPLSRPELPAQLEDVGYKTLATDLRATIIAVPQLPRLARSVADGIALLGAVQEPTPEARPHAA